MSSSVWIIVAGIVCFLIGAIGGPALGDDAAFPVWIFTWLGLILLVVGAGMWFRNRRT